MQKEKPTKLQKAIQKSKRTPSNENIDNNEELSEKTLKRTVEVPIIKDFQKTKNFFKKKKKMKRKIVKKVHKKLKNKQNVVTEYS